MSKIFLTSTLIFLHHSFLLGVNGLTAEITDLNAKDISFQKEKELPYLKKPFISSSPADKNDQLNVGRLGIDGGKKESILKFVRKLAEPSESPKHGKTFSL